jgi:hypothetical protein
VRKHAQRVLHVVTPSPRWCGSSIVPPLSRTDNRFLTRRRRTNWTPHRSGAVPHPARRSRGSPWRRRAIPTGSSSCRRDPWDHTGNRSP